MNITLLHQLDSLLLSCFTLSPEIKEKIKKNASKLSDEDSSLLIDHIQQLRKQEIQKIESLDIAQKQKLSRNIKKRQVNFITEKSRLDHEKDLERANKILDSLD